MLSSEAGLTYVHELHYSNGAVYRGQIKSVEKLRKERTERDIMSPSASRNSYISQSNTALLNEQDRHSSVVNKNPPTLDSTTSKEPDQKKPSTASNTFIERNEYASAGKVGERGSFGGNQPNHLMMQSPSVVSQPGTRMESVYGDEMDDGTRGVRHGFGVQVWQDGAKYKGQWQNNKAHGKGTFWHADGDFYEGEFRNDKSNGYGVFHCTDGTVYEGVWLDDIQHGAGQAHWPDGSSYIGHYMEGRRHGIGTYKWTNGNSYSGEWADNAMNGFGTYEWADGRKYEGYWSKNFMHGQGVYSWPDGRKYDGEYENDQKNGKGSFYWPDGRMYSGGWRQGKQHGEATFTAASGEKRMGIWEEGKRIGWINDFNSSQGNV